MRIITQRHSVGRVNGGTATEGTSADRLFAGSLDGEINIRLRDLAELVTRNS
jgi:hypothetical protein